MMHLLTYLVDLLSRYIHWRSLDRLERLQQHPHQARIFTVVVLAVYVGVIGIWYLQKVKTKRQAALAACQRPSGQRKHPLVRRPQATDSRTKQRSATPDPVDAFLQRLETYIQREVERRRKE
jgi:hypothetical protein